MNVLYVPFSWLLMTLYEFTSSYGLAVILFALVIKIVLLPFSMKSKKGMMRSTRFTPKVKELEKKYEGNKQKYNEEVAKLYKEEGIKPLGGCIWSLIPFPILLILYSCIRLPFTRLMYFAETQWLYLRDTIFPALNITVEVSARNTYDQIVYAQALHGNFERVKDYITAHAQEITDAVGKLPVLRDLNFKFLGLNLGDTPNWKFFTEITSWTPADVWPALGLFLLPIISALLAWLSTKISSSMTPQQSSDPQNSTMKSMTLLMPIMSLWIGYVMPAVMCVYWIATSVFSVIQDVWLTKRYTKILDIEDAANLAAKKAKEAELEEKRLLTERLRAENATQKNPNTSRRKIQRQDKAESERKSAEWAAAKGEAAKKEPRGGESRVGDRPYARGRNYVPDRFENGFAEQHAPDEEPPENVEEVPQLQDGHTEAGAYDYESIDAGEIGQDDAD